MGKDSLLNNYPPDHAMVTGEGLNGFLGHWDNTPKLVDYHHDAESSDVDYIEDDEDVESRTYDGWLSVGRKVLRGEKSHRSNGKALFYRSQTKNIESSPSRVAKCNGCGDTLNSHTNKICKDCGWMICRECYSCGCD